MTIFELDFKLEPITPEITKNKFKFIDDDNDIELQEMRNCAMKMRGSKAGENRYNEHFNSKTQSYYKRKTSRNFNFSDFLLNDYKSIKLN